MQGAGGSLSYRGNILKFIRIIINNQAKINLRAWAGIAKPNPKMGQSLGPLGINMMQFCKVFYSQ